LKFGNNVFPPITTIFASIAACVDGGHASRDCIMASARPAWRIPNFQFRFSIY